MTGGPAVETSGAAGEGSGHGKLILLGEHAVVYGVPALVCGLERALAARARPIGGPSELWLLGEQCRLGDRSETPLPRALAALLGAGRGLGSLAGVSLHVSGDLPHGMGLGFSAAAGVALGRAVEALLGGGDDAAVTARAMAWERVFHGNPSGIDVAAAVRGGALRFVRGAAIERVPVGAPLALCVGLTGVGASTRRMVEAVAARRARDAERFAGELARVATLVAEAGAALGSGDVATLGARMDANHELLAGWEVSTAAIERLCEVARAAGALGAKLTGSGGGGAVVALAGRAGDPGAARTVERILAGWRAAGSDGFAVNIAARSEGASA